MKKTVTIDDAALLYEGLHSDYLSRRLLEKKISLLEKIIYNLDAAIFIHDLNSNRHIWTNGNYRKLIGFEEEEIRQLCMDEASGHFHPDDMHIIREGAGLLRSGEVNSFSGIYRIRHKEGHWIWIYCNCTVIQNEKNEKPRFVLGFTTDFTPHIQYDKHLNDLIAENHRLVNSIRLNCLTKREKEIVTLLAGGQNIKEISQTLGFSYFTAETHIKNIHTKLGISHHSALLKFAIESGLKS